MTSSPRLETEFDSRRDQKLLVREWRAEQLRRLGVPSAHAALFADLVDWHAIADLVAHGCPPTLALKIVR
jgi:class 3 adenylate cyclase